MSDSLQPHGWYSLPGSSVHGILQARILEWVVISFSGGLPDPGIKPTSTVALALQVNSLTLSHYGSPLLGAGDILDKEESLN